MKLLLDYLRTYIYSNYFYHHMCVQPVHLSKPFLFIYLFILNHYQTKDKRRTDTVIPLVRFISLPLFTVRLQSLFWCYTTWIFCHCIRRISCDCEHTQQLLRTDIYKYEEAGLMYLNRSHLDHEELLH